MDIACLKREVAWGAWLAARMVSCKLHRYDERTTEGLRHLVSCRTQLYFSSSTTTTSFVPFCGCPKSLGGDPHICSVGLVSRCQHQTLSVLWLASLAYPKASTGDMVSPTAVESCGP